MIKSGIIWEPEVIPLSPAMTGVCLKDRRAAGSWTNQVECRCVQVELQKPETRFLVMTNARSGNRDGTTSNQIFTFCQVFVTGKKSVYLNYQGWNSRLFLPGSISTLVVHFLVVGGVTFARCQRARYPRIDPVFLPEHWAKMVSQRMLCPLLPDPGTSPAAKHL